MNPTTWTLGCQIKCRRCAADFRAPQVGDFEYATFVLRIQKSDRYAILFLLKNVPFEEVSNLVDVSPLLSQYHDRVPFMHEAFAMAACDKSDTGEHWTMIHAYDCPRCGSDQLANKREVRLLDKPEALWPVTHVNWMRKTEQEKRLAVEEAIIRLKS